MTNGPIRTTYFVSYHVTGSNPPTFGNIDATVDHRLNRMSDIHQIEEALAKQVGCSVTVLYYRPLSESRR